MHPAKVLVCLLILINEVICRVENDLYLQLVRSDDDLFEFYNPGADRFAKAVEHLIVDQSTNLTADCRRSLTRLKAGLSAREEWALKCELTFLILLA